MTQFSIDTAFALIQSAEHFPVNFDDAWQWLEFSRKDSAKKSFDKCEFSESLDFSSFRQKVEREVGATYKDVIHLTIDCFKSWAMMVQTEKGKLVRQYFLECERKLKEKQQEELNLPKTYLEALKALVVSEETKLALQESLKTAEYTITGYRNVFKGESTFTMKQAADALNLPKMGRNNLIKYLRYKKLLTQGNGSIPTRSAIERGYLIVDTHDWTDNFNNTYTTQSAHFTFKGFCWLVQQLKADGHKIKQTPQAIWDTYYPPTETNGKVSKFELVNV